MKITNITQYIKHDDPINGLEDIQKIVRRRIRDKIFGTVRKVRWKLKLDIDACITTCLLHLVQNGDLVKIYDLNDRLVELSHEYYDKTLGENLVDDLLILSVKDMVRQEAVKIWGEIGPKPGERKWRQSKKQ
jgi:hypothetical protein